jgi:hypothetical protein
VIVLEAVIEFVVFVIECAIHLFWWGGQSERASLLDQSRLERPARRRRVGLGCVVFLLVLVAPSEYSRF